ncbi:MAG TPA: fructose-6-phosphate aldolase [Candidatus Poseidoniales archaeon]|jgi:transaldolase|nr:MAG: fructose-6-phosphate aldolase [Euryarchaeota archaeon]HIG03969.1 fructose-6-phosphate aldolase [Candidatus Poseidoniales archaeon]HIK78644.1 fructose-6-phosphate aldolase [Candidatus Poseidoniales archaeon]
MEFFLDTAIIEEVKEIAEWGILDGVTTNPSLIKKSGRDFKQVVSEIAALCSGPISAEVTALDAAGMVEEGLQLKAELPDNVIIKIPCTPEGLKATKVLSSQGIGVNVTLIFSASQALMSAKAGAMYVSPFIGRIDDTGADGMDLIAEIMNTWDNYPDIDTKVLAASIRHPMHMLQCMQMGVHTATMPTKIFKMLIKHPLTDKGIEGFMADWAEVEKAGNA